MKCTFCKNNNPHLHTIHIFNLQKTLTYHKYLRPDNEAM